MEHLFVSNGKMVLLNQAFEIKAVFSFIACCRTTVHTQCTVAKHNPGNFCFKFVSNQTLTSNCTNVTNVPLGPGTSEH